MQSFSLRYLLEYTNYIYHTTKFGKLEQLISEGKMQINPNYMLNFSINFKRVMKKSKGSKFLERVMEIMSQLLNFTKFTFLFANKK